MRIITNQPLMFVGVVYDKVTNEAVASFLQEVDTKRKCDELNASAEGRYDWRMFRILSDDKIWFDEVIP